MTEHSHNIDLSYEANKKSLTTVLVITSAMMAVEFIGGIASKSLSLVSDSGHMLTDSLALSLSLFALWFSKKPATRKNTYGFYRAEILASLLNGSLLIIIALFIFYEAIQRFINPTEVNSGLMLVVALIGLIVNLFGAYILSKADKGNLNIK